MISVYYDGKCGLCRREIAHYRRIAAPETFLWVDVTMHPAALQSDNIDYVEALKSLHVRDSDGVLHREVAAFMVIWRHLPAWYWRSLGRFTALPGIRQLAGILYRLFARWRFNRLDHCQLALDQQSRN